jgi:hypothetical protein
MVEPFPETVSVVEVSVAEVPIVDASIEEEEVPVVEASIIDAGFEIIPDSLFEARAILGIRNAMNIDTMAARAIPFMRVHPCKLAP